MGRKSLDLCGSDMGKALSLLSRLPVPVDHEDQSRAGRLIWAYPLAGAVLGLVGGAVGAALLWVGVPAAVAAAVALGALIAMTGGMHEDGLADCADGTGARDRDRILDVMRDSRIGAYGALALVVSLLIRWSALSALATPWGLVLAMGLVGAVSRVPMAMMLATLRPARKDGMAASIAAPSLFHAMVAVSLGLLMLFSATGLAGFLIVPVMGISLVPLIRWARLRLGGQTGDVLGASQQISEMSVLVCLAGLWG